MSYEESGLCIAFIFHFSRELQDSENAANAIHFTINETPEKRFLQFPDLYRRYPL